MHDEALYLNPATAVDDRVQDLIQRMSLEEKVAQVGSIRAADLLEDETFSVEKARKLLTIGIGQITRVAGSTGAEPRKAGEIANDIQRFLLEETRLRIPAIVHEECLSGLMGSGATTFPQAIRPWPP